MIKRIMFAGLFCLASSTASNAQSLASTGGEIQNALDANSSTRWTTGTSQVPGQIFQIDLGRVAGVSGITLSNCGSPGDHPVSLAVLLSLNGSDFFPGSAGSTNGDPDCTTTVRFDQQEARFIFLQQTGNGQNYWSIHEVDIETDEPTVQILRGDSGNLAAATNTGAFSGQNIFQFTPDRSDGNQLWTEIDRGDGFFSYAKLNTTFCIDGGNGGANQQNVYLWTCGNGSNLNQHWEKQQVGGNVSRLIKSNAPFAIDGGSGAGGNRSNVMLFTEDSGSSNLFWSVN